MNLDLETLWMFPWIGTTRKLISLARMYEKYDVIHVLTKPLEA